MSDDVKALIESIIDDHAELHIYQDEGYVTNSDALAEKIVAALEASVRAPAVDREALVAAMHRRYEFEYDECHHGLYSGGPSNGEPFAMCERWADGLIASGILLDAAEVEARGLEKANAIAERVAEDAEQRRNADPTDAEYWEGFRRGARSVAHSVSARAQQVREGNA